MAELAEYTQNRTALIASERAIRFDASAIANASDRELRATEIVDEIKKREAREIWSGKELMYPGMEFLLAKDTIVKTELFNILKKMPKGAVLHAHFGAMCPPAFLYETALEYRNMHIRVQSRIASNVFPCPEFKPLPARTSSVGLTHEAYTPGTWVPLDRARREFKFGKDAFDAWIIGSMCIDSNEAYIKFNSSVKIWEKFGETLLVVAGMMRYEPILKRCFRHVFLSAIEDRISYIELRISFFIKLGIREDGSEDFSHREYMLLFDEAVKEVKNSMKEQGREDEFVGAKVIYTTFRTVDKEDLVWYLEECMQLKAEFPDLIAGFDISTHEDAGHPLRYFAEQLLWFKAETARRGLDIPFIFHAGETLGDGSDADCNLYDALLLGTKRIGHGFSLANHPRLIQMCKERNIAIEVCPISNEVLRLTASMPMHPLPVLLNNGVCVSLSCDDPTMFGNFGLSFDFYQVLVASEITSLISLGQLARQSLEYSCLNESDKKQALEVWEARWIRFIDEIISPVESKTVSEQV